MNDLEVLKALSGFLKEKVASKIKLEKVPDDNQVEGDYELVNPAVYQGWLPPKNFLESYGYDIPGMIVMIDDGTDDNESADLNIRIKVVTYDPGTTKEDGTLTPDAKGYKDLLNLIFKIRLALSENVVINDTITVNKPIKWNMDEEQNYPYWSANVSFPVSIASLKFNIDKYL